MLKPIVGEQPEGGVELDIFFQEMDLLMGQIIGDVRVIIHSLQFEFVDSISLFYPEEVGILLLADGEFLRSRYDGDFRIEEVHPVLVVGIPGVLIDGEEIDADIFGFLDAIEFEGGFGRDQPRAIALSHLEHECIQSLIFDRGIEYDDV